ncbi:universal stress protein [Corynebacterium uberis]|uniref:universal stress protein n=1 Tax=Corynebacterium TaxID=1716 RepID=UPI001D0ADA44|nr:MULTISPECIES: universal stress protein [Corynebacterium]MCZ9309630.1 universal stress protein [Corynebacterium sp. c6VSa_13]UDL73436.1 universal stress protein [Corynebacterium uberis]UDL75684.1 universal stress protein [Corynebacterium uberis]UDL77897.1 universal stress protein [Corynebacterium uberis]UDL80180.1 universal stress protein [Corynebacterium uberis]
MAEPTVLVAFDGSEESRRALRYAALLLRPDTVDIVTAWEPMARQAARASSMSGLHQGDWLAVTETDDPAWAAAREICRAGVLLAEGWGLSARGSLVESTTSVWSAIIDAAAELHPAAIVTGTRAVRGVKSLWRNSTADSLVKNAGVPVFIVPPCADPASRPD